MGYLHGIRIREASGGAALATGDTAVIGLVGTAPKGTVGQVKLITSLLAAQTEFGNDIDGFTIPAALEVIFSEVNAKVLVVNVLATEKATALLEATGKMLIGEDGIVATHIYKSILPTAVDYAAEIVKGLQMLLNVDDALGVKPNIILAPGYSQIPAVLQSMVSSAEKLDGFAAIDIVADNVQAALAARNGDIYNTASSAAILCYPLAKRLNIHENTTVTIGLSVYWALSKAKRDVEAGYWISPSNSIINISGTDVAISSSLTEESADTNLLNGSGIVTVFRKSGMGTRLWGNWTAAFPATKTADGMIAPRSTRMAIREALIDAAITYLDKSATALTIDMILSDVNSFLRSLIGKGAIVDGECKWEEEKNTKNDIAQGKLSFTLRVKYAPSLDLLEFEEIIDF
ncbi:MAG: phage tail sheath subtilisin-like domain-containing protein [Bacteroidales bacterium]